MYTKIDIEENKKMNEILKQNQLKMRKQFEKKQKQNKRINILLFISSSLFFIGLIYLVSVIENMRF